MIEIETGGIELMREGRGAREGRGEGRVMSGLGRHREAMAVSATPSCLVLAGLRRSG